MSSIPSIRFHPTDAELVNFLKKFLKGETLQCPIKFAEIYRDQPPWQIFGSEEEKIGYFITPLKKRKESDKRHAQTCANGTWRGETSANPIKKHGKGSVVGFRRNYKYHSKENSTSTSNWLMREYFFGNDFFTENNISKQEFAVCRIKKHIKQKKVKDDAVTYNMEEHVVAGIIQDMLLHGPDAYCTTRPAEHDQVMEETDQWDSIIDEVCDEKADKVEKTTTLMQGEYDLRGFNQINDRTNEAAMEIQNTTVSSITLEEEAYGQIEQLQAHRADHIIGSNDFWEAMNKILKGVTVDIPHDLWLDDHLSPLLLITNENI